MRSDVLQKFLDKNLLDLGDTTDKFVFLTESANDLVAELKADKERLVRSVSVLIGGEYPENEPILELCDKAIKNRWPTYRNRFPSDVNILFRATLLQTIASIVDEDSSFAAIVYYAGSGAFPFVATTRESEIFKDFFHYLGERVEVDAKRLWARPTSFSLPKTKKVETPALSGIEMTWFTNALKNAAGATGVAGANAAYPNATPEWLNHYGKATAEAINSTILAILKENAPKLLAMPQAENALAIAHAKGLFDSLASDNRKADLIYWKESLYSEGRGISYRSMSPNAAVYWSAFDLHEQISHLHPTSVEYFLRETIRLALGSSAATETQTLQQFCTELAKDADSISVSRAAVSGQRLTLTELAQNAARGDIDLTKVSTLVGVPSATAISREEYAVWLFRDFQAWRLTISE